MVSGLILGAFESCYRGAIPKLDCCVERVLSCLMFALMDPTGCSTLGLLEMSGRKAEAEAMVINNSKDKDAGDTRVNQAV